MEAGTTGRRGRCVRRGARVARGDVIGFATVPFQLTEGRTVHERGFKRRRVILKKCPGRLNFTCEQ